MTAEMALDSSERQRLLAQYAEIAVLAGGLAHEIKNPLSTMSLNLELLVEDLTGGETPREQRMLKKVLVLQRECERLQVLLEDFLRFARAGELDLEEADLNSVVSEFIEFFQPEAAAGKVELSPHLASDLPRVRIDKDLFRQVLMNLALNSRQAMPQGGLLELQTGAEGRHVCLSLIDTGCGMSAATLAKVFDVFYSTKPNGSGLGLPTVRKIIERHGGGIQIDSEPGKGTRVTILLPAVATTEE